MSETNPGATGQESAAPATATPAETTVDTSANNPAPATQATDKPAPMPADERREQAALRRSREVAEAKAEVQRIKAEREDFAKSFGYTSYDEMRQASAKEKLAKGEFTPETLAPYIQPLVEKALQERAPALDAVKAALDQQDAAMELSAFQAKFPEAGIKDFADFKTAAYWPKFSALVANNVSLEDAYVASNFEAVVKARTEAAKQAAINSVNSKQHMQPAEGDADGIDNTVVPDGTLDWYRAAYPNLTEKQYKAKYRDFLKGK
jgi:hypothetical protein